MKPSLLVGLFTTLVAATTQKLKISQVFEGKTIFLKFDPSELGGYYDVGFDVPSETYVDEWVFDTFGLEDTVSFPSEGSLAPYHGLEIGVNAFETLVCIPQNPFIPCYVQAGDKPALFRIEELSEGKFTIQDVGEKKYLFRMDDGRLNRTEELFETSYFNVIKI